MLTKYADVVTGGSCVLDTYLGFAASRTDQWLLSDGGWQMQGNRKIWPWSWRRSSGAKDEIVIKKPGGEVPVRRGKNSSRGTTICARWQPHFC